MQIHELNSFVGTPGAGDYLAIDDGSETTKVEASNLGVTTQMTQAEAEAGTETAPRVVAPSIFKSAVVAIASAISGVFVSMTNPKYTLDTSAASGDDYNLTQALTSLGWLTDVVTSGVLGVKKLLYKMLSNIGTVVTSGGLVSSIPSGTKTNASSITLGSGKWLVIYQAALPLSAAKNFQAAITLGTDRAAQQITTGASGIHRLNLSTVIETASSATVYGTMYHTNGSAVDVNTSTMMAIRII